MEKAVTRENSESFEDGLPTVPLKNFAIESDEEDFSCINSSSRLRRFPSQSDDDDQSDFSKFDSQPYAQPFPADSPHLTNEININYAYRINSVENDPYNCCDFDSPSDTTATATTSCNNQNSNFPADSKSPATVFNDNSVVLAPPEKYKDGGGGSAVSPNSHYGADSSSSSPQCRLLFANSTPYGVMNSKKLVTSSANSSTCSSSSNDARFAEIYQMANICPNDQQRKKGDKSEKKRWNDAKNWHNNGFHTPPPTAPSASTTGTESYFSLTYNKYNQISTGKHFSPHFPLNMRTTLTPTDNASSDSSSISSDLNSSPYSGQGQINFKQLIQYDQDLKTLWTDSKFIDTHCHLDLLFNKLNMTGAAADFETLREKYQKIAWSPNFSACIADFCFPEIFKADNFDLLNKVVENDSVWLAIGCHPHQANAFNDETEKLIIEKICLGKTVAFGELGLDYSSNNFMDRDLQKQVLRRQLNLAVKYRKPILLHCRDAADDCFTIMKEIVPHDYPIHWHCFMNLLEVSRQWSEYFHNLYFGVTLGVFSPRGDQVSFWRNCPVDRLLIETDAPYFLPRHYRWKEFGNLQYSYPGLGALAAIKLAELRTDIKTVPEILKQIYANTQTLYKI